MGIHRSLTDTHLHSALKPLIRTAVFYLLSVLAIAGVLVAGKYLVDGIRGAISARERVELLVAVQEELGSYRVDRAGASTARMREARQLPLAAVDERIRAITQELATTANEPDESVTLLQTGPQRYAKQLATRYRSRVERVLLQQELGYLQQVRAYLFALQSRAAAQTELTRLLEQHRVVYARLLQKRQEIAQLDWIESRRMQYPWARSPKLDRLAAEANALMADNNRAAAAYRAQAQALQRMQSVEILGDFMPDLRQLDRALQALDEQVDEARNIMSSHLLTRLIQPFKKALPLACGILVLAIAGRAAIRAFFYYVVAPLATRAAPVRLDGEGNGAYEQVTLVSPSAVSQTLRLALDEELLVLPSYLQSAPVGAARGTRWLIRHRPWASLSSGMAMLTCVRARSHEEQIVLSASDDGLREIALLRIPTGRALAIQPRALVGVLAAHGRPIDIGWRWRLTSFHAWLSLQLRFFVLRGPLTLAVQGTRGVRIQAAQATQSIRQTATLGFSTDVAYSTVRSEPFLPYLRGQAPLLNDRFSGAGVYLYDETPGLSSQPGRIGRGIEGLTDALLKLLGY